MAVTMKAPANLKELLRYCAKDLWMGKAYEKTAYRNVEGFIDVVGNLKLAEVTTLSIDAWLREVRGTIKDSTVNRKLVNIFQVLKFAHDRDWIERMPKIKFYDEPEGRIRWIEPEEERQMMALLEAWGEFEFARFVTVLIETGMRRGELVNLKPKDVRGDEVHLWAPDTKTGKSRVVPLTDTAIEALKGALPFTLNKNKIDQLWKRLRTAMGMEDDADFVLHILRHTAATRLLADSGNIMAVKEFLGHENIETTKRYAHLSTADLKRIVRRETR